MSGVRTSHIFWTTNTVKIKKVPIAGGKLYPENVVNIGLMKGEPTETSSCLVYSELMI